FRRGRCPMIIDHITLGVADYDAAKRFYTAALAPLGITLLTEGHGWAGFGSGRKPAFWFGANTKLRGVMHVAFAAAERAQVRRFYEAALAAGGKDNGAPGLRPVYHANYYGAFVFD